MDSRIHILFEDLKKLNSPQLEQIERIVRHFNAPFALIQKHPNSDIITSDNQLLDFGNVLRLHHCFSREPFTKDKFEYALEQVCNRHGIEAKLAPKGNPGHDITIKGTNCSLKTEASRAIQLNKIHISKFMELGKGVWGDKVGDLHGLREQFLKHMRAYDRIFTLRCIEQGKPRFVYELVEIPKALLEESKNGKFVMMHDSKQSPKPGYCTVSDLNGGIKFQLYFDGGTERKLQIKSIDKKLCKVHGLWAFEITN
jgi:type II restriction enzyme